MDVAFRESGYVSAVVENSADSLALPADAGDDVLASTIAGDPKENEQCRNAKSQPSRYAVKTVDHVRLSRWRVKKSPAKVIEGSPS